MGHFDMLIQWMKEFNHETGLIGEDEYIKKHLQYIIDSQHAFI